MRLVPKAMSLKTATNSIFMETKFKNHIRLLVDGRPFLKKFLVKHDKAYS